MNPLVRLTAVLIATFAPGIGAATAAELVAGDYGAGPAVEEATAAAGSDAAPGDFALGQDGGAGLVLDFTPRGAGFASPDQSGVAPRVRLELGIVGDADAGAEALTLGGEARPSWLAEDDAGAAPGELSIGGALHWSGWSLGGALTRAPLLGGEAELVAATIGYGSLTASLAFGETERPSLPALDVLKLSTDVAAWSWLTLESDVALGSAPEADESVAVGRLGVRLNF